jgi:hypothetical protein
MRQIDQPPRQRTAGEKTRAASKRQRSSISLALRRVAARILTRAAIRKSGPQCLQKCGAIKSRWAKAAMPSP